MPSTSSSSINDADRAGKFNEKINDKLILFFAEIRKVKKENRNCANKAKSQIEFEHDYYPGDACEMDCDYFRKTIPSFVYPVDDDDNSDNLDCDDLMHYSFVLTDVAAKWTYGYCRRRESNSNFDRCENDCTLVLLSNYSLHSMFYHILDHCAVLLASSSKGEARNDKKLLTFLRAINRLRFDDLFSPAAASESPPQIGGDNCDANNVDYRRQAMQHEMLYRNINLAQYFAAISARNMISIFACALNERRIVVTSARIDRLSACAQAINDLLHPLRWQHIFVPLLPAPMIDYLLAPMPYLIGVTRAEFRRRFAQIEELGDVVIVDVDADKIITSFDGGEEDYRSLPRDVRRRLEREIGKIAAKKSAKMEVDTIDRRLSRAFIGALATLIGDYRRAIICVQFCDDEDDQIWTSLHHSDRRQSRSSMIFDRDKFVTGFSTNRRPYVRRLLRLQMMQQFLQSKIDQLNRGIDRPSISSSLDGNDDFAPQSEASSQTIDDFDAELDARKFRKIKKIEGAARRRRSVRNICRWILKACQISAKERGKVVMSKFYDNGNFECSSSSRGEDEDENDNFNCTINCEQRSRKRRRRRKLRTDGCDNSSFIDYFYHSFDMKILSIYK